MPLVFACITPHSPITIPSIGKEKAEQLAKTLAALKELEGELYVMQPDTLFVISPHAPTAEKAFSINLAPEFSADFQEFGDESLQLRLLGDIELVSKIREYADSHDASSVNIINESVLDYGTAVSLYHLTKHLPHVKIVPISVSQLGVKEHYDFGALLRNVAMRTNKRVAIIASTELSHSLSADTPQGYHPDGQTLDSQIQKMITACACKDILTLNQDVVRNAKATNALKTLAMLFGALDGMGQDAKVICYEHPLGVGLLVGQFNLI